MTMNSPDSHSPIDPPEVDETTEKLSALLDGELEASEQFAVDHETTIQDLSAGMAASKSGLAALASTPAPSAARSQHLARALDEMDSPEVRSLAAARSSRRLGDAMQLVKAQRLNECLRMLSAVAAVVVVVGGLSVVSLQGGLGGSDSADESAVSVDDSSTTAALQERSIQGGVADDGASDDSTAAASESMDELADAAGDQPEANDADLSQSAQVEPLQIAPGFDLTNATLSDLPDYASARSSISPNSTAPVNEAVCYDAAARVVEEERIVEGIAVQQGGVEFELVVLSDGELLVFETPGCVRVD
jgi:hypothetical protein